MPVSSGRIAALAFFWLACPCRAAEIPAAIGSAARLSEQAASAASPSEANALAFQSLQGRIESFPEVRQPAGPASRPALTLQPSALPAVVSDPPAPARAKKPGRRRVLRGAGMSAMGLVAGLLCGALLGAGLGLLDLGLRTKEMGKGRGATRAALALPAMVAGAVIGQLTFWAAGAKFMWDKGSKPRAEAA